MNRAVRGSKSNGGIRTNHLKTSDISISKYSGVHEKKTPYDFLIELEKYQKASTGKKFLDIASYATINELLDEAYEALVLPGKGDIRYKYFHDEVNKSDKHNNNQNRDSRAPSPVSRNNGNDGRSNNYYRSYNNNKGNGNNYRYHGIRSAENSQAASSSNGNWNGRAGYQSCQGSSVPPAMSSTQDNSIPVNGGKMFRKCSENGQTCSVPFLQHLSRKSGAALLG
ncbi:unnamed protein product [Allacma fusca]|uniref:Uncharacterized protein n=1 Tax=Allacma fusca TaxID=39272 RepID=A0A8J2P8E1_9HEXA|nr:unnamed protein product [Allacma fusca]